jgi:hypothetical protein
MRADLLHFELIRLGCDTFGSEFAQPFIRICHVPSGSDAQSTDEVLCTDKFRLDGQRLPRLELLFVALILNGEAKARNGIP